MTSSKPLEMSLLPRAAYVSALRNLLPAQTRERATSRLAFLPVHIAVVVVATLAIAGGWVPWVVVPLLSIAIAASFGGLTFIAHETLHGAIVKHKRLQHVIGWIGFLPFAVSPRLWTAWHNADHHARAQHDDDPDVYPTLEHYRESRAARFSVDAFSLGGGRWRGLLCLLLGFTVQSATQLALARRLRSFDRRRHVLAIAETALAVAVWVAVAALVGPLSFLFVFVIPHLLANTIVMMFILTNHSLSPRVSVNDPLASGLTVTLPPLFSWLTLGFGYHVEHHLYPAMSTRHAPSVRRLLQAHWPDRYRSMPLVEALRRLHRSARVYKTPTTLVDPRTGMEYATL
jgi:fatty acid desaturase